MWASPARLAHILWDATAATTRGVFMKDRLSELTLLLLICLAPWAFGSVEAWAELGLYAGIALVTILNFGSPSGSSGRGRWVCLPSLALLGLVLLALFQATPIWRGGFSSFAPLSAALRANLLPKQPEQVMGDSGPAVALPAATLSLEPDSTLQTAARLAAAWLLFQAVLGLQSAPGVSVRFARVVVFNAALLALFAIVQGLTWNGRIYWVRPAHASIHSSWSAGGPFLSHSHLAAYLNMGLGLALGLLLHGNWRDFLRRDSTKLWTAYAAAIIAVGVIASHSRSGFLGLLVASLLLACFLRRRLIQLGFGLAVILVVIGLFLALLAGSSSYGSRLATILDLGDEGYLARLEVWRGALRAWWARPVWGSGFGVFPVAITPYLRHSKLVFFTRAENEYVDMLVEGGAVGFLLALAFLAGVGGLARRAILSLPGGRERGLVVGAGFGLIALSVQSFADFGPHVPAVGVLAVVLCGLIARQARAGGMCPEEQIVRSSHLRPKDQAASKREKGNRIAQRPELPRSVDASAGWRLALGPAGRAGWLAAELAWLGSVLVSAVLVGHAIRDARIENVLTGAGLPQPGTYMPTVGTIETMSWGLDEWRDALQDALRRRPNWAEGYLRLGLVHLGMYRRMTKQWLEDCEMDPHDMGPMAEPLWLLGTVHQGQEPTAGPLQAADVLSFEPVVSQLVPAARCFLEARRCSPFLALPHAELASLDYLLGKGNSASTYATRALSLSGNNELLPTFLAQVAIQAGDRKLAALCWRKTLEVNPSSWLEVADAAGLVLSADEILSDVLADGRSTIRFADHLYAREEERPARDRYFRAGVERLPVDQGITAAERLFLEAHALAGLEQPEQARKQMEAALTLEPTQSAWRQEYIDWLLRWGRPDEAHAQALSGQYFSPDSPAIRAAVDRTAEVLARGGSPP
jgi:O-antigen ligase/tetratricopeptide (TPR) repeat protein